MNSSLSLSPCLNPRPRPRSRPDLAPTPLTMGVLCKFAPPPLRCPVLLCHWMNGHSSSCSRSCLGVITSVCVPVTSRPGHKHPIKGSSSWVTESREVQRPKMKKARSRDQSEDVPNPASPKVPLLSHSNPIFHVKKRNPPRFSNLLVHISDRKSVV